MESEFSRQTPRLSAKDRIRRRVKTSALKFLAQSGLASMIGSRYAGRGVALMFHEFTHCPKSKLDQGCRIEDFEAILKKIRKSGRDIVTLSEAVRRLNEPGSRPFVVLTFDDGYRSNLELALPVMERYDAPAIIFVPTEMMTRTINAWWLGLRDLVESNDSIDMDPMGVRFHCPDLEGKIATLRRLTAWVWDDFQRAGLLQDVFHAHSVSMPDLVDQLAMTETDMVESDRHPLIEIGAHTTTHRALTILSEAEVEEDISANKHYLQDKLQREVPHFAYPYGPPSISGYREADIVRKLGFKVAVTTEPGCLFPEHLDQPFLLPRQDAEYTEDSLVQAVCGMNGVFRAMASRGGSPIANPAVCRD
ncbi:polysaccharide deacetylase family protein [Roseibium sp.]|uniref:polysaccharide deacetylase family protein n=1 Tax=Roseibium sp. TaxID=1936156 RepID=UPI003A97DCA2